MSSDRTFRVSKVAILEACDGAAFIDQEAAKAARQEMVAILMRPRWWRKGKSQAEAEKIALLEWPDADDGDTSNATWLRYEVRQWRNICMACCELELNLSKDEAAWVGKYMLRW